MTAQASGRPRGGGGEGRARAQTGHARQPPARATKRWETFYNRSGYFNLFNRNKRDLGLDLGTDRGREIFLRLVEEADIVVENNSARVFPQLGLDYSTLAERNPRIVLCSICRLRRHRA